MRTQTRSATEGVSPRVSPEMRAAEVFRQRYGVEPCADDWGVDEWGRPGLCRCLAEAIRQAEEGVRAGQAEGRPV